jgi:uncharacterized repeat protein (TIGR03803 family)
MQAAPRYRFSTVHLAIATLILAFLAPIARPAAGQTAIPATARQAVRMPEFTSRLHRASVIASRPARGRSWLPPDDVIYDNGPINGTTDAWTINFGFAVTNTFAVPASGGQLTGMTFGAWVFPGDLVQSVEVFIGTSQFDHSLSDQVINLTQSNCVGNQYGFNVCTEAGNFATVNLAGGTYWVTLVNATVNNGDPVYWDENSGSSLAVENSIGTIPSEAFAMLGTTTTTTTCFPYCEPPPPPCFQSGEQGVHVIHDFAFGSPSGLTQDASGGLYGTTTGEGSDGMGMVYRLTQRAGNWLFTQLYSFLGGDNGAAPGGVILGPGGALFGTAQGGLQQCGNQGSSDCGVVYKLMPPAVACPEVMCSWHENVLYRFTGDPDGWAPVSGTLVSDDAGNLFGATARGGDFGQGTIFKLSPSPSGWTESVIASFENGAPNSLLVGHDGNLYGIAGRDAFQLVPSANGWTKNVLHTFRNNQNFQRDGSQPNNLVQDAGGNLYGISTWNYLYYWQYRTAGIFWKLSPSDHGWQFRVLRFKQTYPMYYDDLFTSLAIDSQGGIYLAGSTIAYDWSCVDHNFGCFWDLDGDLGAHFQNEVFEPYGMTADLARNRLYGVTYGCGLNNSGTIWEISP